MGSRGGASRCGSRGDQALLARGGGFGDSPRLRRAGVRREPPRCGGTDPGARALGPGRRDGGGPGHHRLQVVRRAGPGPRRRARGRQPPAPDLRARLARDVRAASRAGRAALSRVRDGRRARAHGRRRRRRRSRPCRPRRRGSARGTLPRRHPTELAGTAPTTRSVRTRRAATSELDVGSPGSARLPRGGFAGSSRRAEPSGAGGGAGARGASPAAPASGSGPPPGACGRGPRRPARRAP